ncbi:MAG: hypothetical protein R3F65_05975 [bacterium]|nr:hypothetical protein [Myxococcales bacterium]
MKPGHLLLLFLPDRHSPGTLKAVLRKYPVQYVEGCAEPGVRERFADQRGVLVTVVDWAPAEIVSPSRGADRVQLPDEVLALLDEVSAAAPDGFDLAIIEPGDGLRYHAEIGRARLARPLAVGCRYEVRR